MKFWLGLILGVLILGAIVFLSGCDSGGERKEIDLSARISNADLRKLAQAKKDADVLWFGFDLRAGPKEDARQYIPFLKYLERSTGYRFNLRFTPKGGSIANELGRGVVQFAAVGAGTYILAHAKYGVIPVVRGLNSQGKAQYRSVIVVRPDSPIRKIEDLRGKNFAFGSITSTQGYLIPGIILLKHGITLRDLGSYRFTGSHRNCANAVISHRFDACGMQDTMAKKLAKEGLLRIIYTSKPYPSSGIAANRDVPSVVLSRVKQALLDFQPKGRDAAGLYNWDMTEMPRGFIEAHDGDYAELRKWAKKIGYIPDINPVTAP